MVGASLIVVIAGACRLEAWQTESRWWIVEYDLWEPCNT
jgi:hypothetical protein